MALLVAVLLGLLVVETLAAEGDVGLVTPDELDLFLEDGSEGEVGILVADLADGGKLLDLLCFGDEVDDVLEACAQEGAVEGGDDHHLAKVGGLLRELNHLLNS